MFETCDECNGTGRDPGGLSEFERTDCPVCGGTGRVYLETPEPKPMRFETLTMEELLAASLAIAGIRLERKGVA